MSMYYTEFYPQAQGGLHPYPGKSEFAKHESSRMYNIDTDNASESVIMV